jgi:hypothetical protein
MKRRPTLLAVSRLPGSLAGFAAGMLLAGSAFAQTAPTAEREFAVTASSPQWCAVTAPGGSAPVASNETGAVAPLGASLSIFDLVDPVTLSTRATTARMVFEAACNYPHQVVIRSERNGLRRDITTQSNVIANAVPYVANISWGGNAATLTTDAQIEFERLQAITTESAVSGTLELAFVIQRGATNLGSGSPLGAGVYNDVVSIEVGPL